MTTKTLEKRHLLEAASLIGESSREDGAWKVRLISEGQGSSGFYSRELLENHYHVFNDILSFNNHPTGWDGPEARNFTEIVGEIVGDVWVENDERGMAAITGWYLPDPEYRDKLERYKKKLGVSIYAMGEGEFDEDTGNFYVTSFEDDPYNSLDVVIAAGARGKFLESMRKVYDSRQNESDKTEVTSASDKERITMDKEVKEALEALTALVQSLVAEKQAAGQAEAQAEADAMAVEAAVSAYDAAVAAIDEADLLAPQVAALRAEARKGVDVAPLIEQAKAIKEAAVEAATAKEEARPGVFLGESNSTSYKVGAWN